jgi:ethanolamine kinase
MSPKEFMKARDETSSSSSDPNKNNNNNNKYKKVIVDGRPYLPYLSAQADDSNSIKDVVIRILGLPSTTSSRDQLFISVVTGGNTNRLLCVSGISEIKSTTFPFLPDAVLVRIFGAVGLIDRDVETSTYAALAQQGLALQYYGRFENGRVEEWSDWKPLEEKDLLKPDISSYIAIQLARFHTQFNIPKHLFEYHNPQTQTPTMWTQLHGWYQTARKGSYQNDCDTQRVLQLQLEQLDDELDWLRAEVISSTAKIGFCHNDLLASNILSTVPLQLIDFEYGGINYLSYDIANHFNEFAGGTAPVDNATPDYTKFPSKELQRHFCRSYLQETMSYHKKTLSEKEMEAQIDHLMQEIQGFVLANHLVWGLWGIIQAITEGCNDFDYIHYGSCRIQRYFYEKERYQP